MARDASTADTADSRTVASVDHADPRARAARPSELPPAMRSEVERVMASRGGVFGIQALGLRELVDDHADKFLLLGQNRRPSAIVFVAPATHPTIVREATEKAQMARACLGPDLGASVLVPLHVGESSGLSFSVAPYCSAFSDARGIGRWHKWRLRKPVLGWLSELTRRSATLPAPQEADARFGVPLRAMASHAMLRPEDRHAATVALGELESGVWIPRLVLSHGDFWAGNLLRPPSDQPSERGFVVIDWHGSSAAGYAIYDLLRMAMSLRVPRAVLGEHLLDHCRMLQCTLPQARHYLLCALGHLASHLGEWPVREFVGTVRVCVDYLDQHLPGHPG